MTGSLISAAAIFTAVLAFLIFLGMCMALGSIVTRGLSVLFQPTTYEIENKKARMTRVESAKSLRRS